MFFVTDMDIMYSTQLMTIKYYPNVGVLMNATS